MDVEHGLQSFDVSEDALTEALDVFSGELTCCRLGHSDESPCDKEELMLPILGLYADIYAERHGHHADAYGFIEPIKDRLFPKDFDYTHINPEDGVETTTTQVLFGDLIAAVEQTIDGEGATAAASNPLRGANFAPGTHAQRHRVRQSGSKHGGARRVFSRPLTPLVTKFLGSSSSAD